MTTSLRHVCQHCLGRSGPLRLYRDLFGYPWGRIDRTLSVLDHVRRIRGTSINLCVIFVGHEPGFGGSFTQAQAVRVQHAIDVMRAIYAQVNFGVRRIYWHFIPQALSVLWLTVDADGATNLTETISSDTDGIDLFMVQMVIGAAGWSNSDGPCDKDDKGRTGAVLSVTANSDDDDFFGAVVAHEIGHYLTLTHGTDPTNLMGTDLDGDGVGDIDGTALTAPQGALMKVSCWARPPC